MIITVINVISVILGTIIGWFIPWLDRIAYIYILHPETQVAQYIKYQIAAKQWRRAWDSLQSRSREFDQLTTRGVLFQLAWVVLAFFAITSAAGWFGKTLVMAVGLRILVEEWREYFKDKAVLKQKLFWQIKREWNDAEVKIYLIGMTLVVAWLLRLMI
ncbi:hypothetical protein KKH13_01440 [Patescibacteria group bacterium]|nr:hypothetical protein [Patescibacteria group bacterium]